MKTFGLSLCVVAASAATTTVQAQQFGDYAGKTVDTLIQDYPGRYRGTQSFEGATDWMQARLGDDAEIQTFEVADGESSNVMTSLPGSGDETIVVGAHFDTFYGRPTLQGLDDNASGAGVLTEIARNLRGVPMERNVDVVAFGAEEEGLVGSRAYVDSLDAEARDSLVGMVNLDSLITGDHLYGHAGINSAQDPSLASLQTHLMAIADELDIDLRANPGLSPYYPEGTGCCSDGESFEALGIPIVYIESTNWEIGDLDGYEQTTNPAIPGGMTWHNPALDNEAVLTEALGEERVEERLRIYSLLLTRLLVEQSNADVLASLRSAGQMARVQEDLLASHHRTLTQRIDARLGELTMRPLAVGESAGAIGVEGSVQPESGFDVEGDQRRKRAGVYAWGDYRVSEAATLGITARFDNGQDELDRGGKLSSDTWQLGGYGLLNDGGPWWLGGDVSAGYSDLDMRRSVFLAADGGPTLLDQTLDGDTHATFYGARLIGGLDWVSGALRTGPFASLDYTRYHIDDYREDDGRRTALAVDAQRYDSLEGSAGWRLQGAIDLRGEARLLPRASVSWVEELADGREERLDVTAADGIERAVSLPEVDEHFGRVSLGMEMRMTPRFSVTADANTRFAHDDGTQAGYTLGAQFRF